jgi:hypothetical protein
MITTAVEPTVCLRDGQVTFFSSIFTSLKNWIDRVKTLSRTFAGAGLETTADFLVEKVLVFLTDFVESAVAAGTAA